MKKYIIEYKYRLTEEESRNQENFSTEIDWKFICDAENEIHALNQLLNYSQSAGEIVVVVDSIQQTPHQPGE